MQSFLKQAERRKRRYSFHGGEEFEGDKGRGDLITCSWSDKDAGTSLIDASSWWDKVAEGEASASRMIHVDELDKSQPAKFAKN